MKDLALSALKWAVQQKPDAVQDPGYRPEDCKKYPDWMSEVAAWMAMPHLMKLVPQTFFQALVTLLRFTRRPIHETTLLSLDRFV